MSDLPDRPRSSCAAAALVASALVVASCAGCGPPPAPPPPQLATGTWLPLNDAVVGEAVTLRRGKTTYTWRVTHITDDEVQVEYVETTEGGAEHGAAPARAFVWARNGWGVQEGFVVRRIDADRIDVGGRSYDCWRLQCHSKGAGVRFYWVSDQVPVNGVVRIAPDLDGDGLPDLGNSADLVSEP